MEGPPLGPGGEDITWPDQVAPRGRKASSTHKTKHQTSNLKKVKHTPQNKIYRCVLQYRSTLQPYILVRVGVGPWAWTTLQPYNTNLPTNRNCLQQWLSR